MCRLSPQVHFTEVRHAHGPLEAMDASFEDTNLQFSVVDNKVDVGHTIEKGNECTQQVLVLMLPAVHMKAADDGGDKARPKAGTGSGGRESTITGRIRRVPRQRNPFALQSSLYLNLKKVVKKEKHKCTKVYKSPKRSKKGVIVASKEDESDLAEISREEDKHEFGKVVKEGQGEVQSACIEVYA